MTDLAVMVEILDRAICSNKPDDRGLTFEVHAVDRDDGGRTELEIYGGGYADFFSVMVFDINGALLKVEAWE